MYPDFSYIFHDFFHTEVDGIGSALKTYPFFIGLAIFISIVWIEKALRERVNVDATMTNKMPGLYLLILTSSAALGSKTLSYGNQADSASPFSMAGALSGLVLGAMVVYFLNLKIAHKKFPLPYLVRDSILFIVTLAFIVSKAGGVIETFIRGKNIAENATSLLYTGVSYHWAFLGGIIAACLYFKNSTIKTHQFFDAIAPVIMISYGIGRLGCHFSGDGDWGIENLCAKPFWFPFPDSWWRFDFPHNVAGIGIPLKDCAYHYCSVLEKPVWPSSLYEGLLGITAGVIFWRIRKQLGRPYLMFGWVLLISAVLRIIIENFRVTDKYNIFDIGISQAQIFYIFVAVIGVALVFPNKFGARRQPITT